MFIRTLPIALDLQIYFQNNSDSQIIVRNIIDPDDNFFLESPISIDGLSNSTCRLSVYIPRVMICLDRRYIYI